MKRRTKQSADESAVDHADEYIDRWGPPVVRRALCLGGSKP
jgi:hypothetical protein